MKAMKNKIFCFISIIALISFLACPSPKSDKSINPSYAENKSYTTTCAEEDNVNFTLWNKDVKKFTITIAHPQYKTEVMS